MDNKTLNQNIASVLIGLCIVALIGMAGYAFLSSKKNPVQPVEVKVVVPVDSTGAMSAETLRSIDELKAELTRHEQLIEDRYMHMLEQKEDMNDLWSVGSMFLAVVLGLFGFFGYKSMSSIEERVQKEAERVAKDKLQATAEQVRTDVVDGMKEQVVAEVDKSMAEYKVTAKKQIDATIQEKVKDSIQQVNDMANTVSDLSTSIGNLDQKVVKLTERLDGQEGKEAQPKRSRRTLANGGKTE